MKTRSPHATVLKKRKFMYLLLVAVLGACSFSVVETPRNVILFIGDGMGFEQVKAAGIYAYGSTGTLAFEQLPYRGEVTTYSANSSITDSAAGATAMATGQKVNNGVISMEIPGDGRELATLLEIFRDRRKSTGLVSTAHLTHATPAAFGAHEPRRNNYSEIALDLLFQSRPDVLLGGGGFGISAEMAAAAGFVVVEDKAELLNLFGGKLIKLSGQFGDGHLPYELDGLGPLPDLSEMTEKALDILEEDPDGFFLMIEGGRIDHAGHANDLYRLILEVLEFDEAVQAAISWMNDRIDTLVVVTADHETGGLSVIADNGRGNLPGVSWQTLDHTAAEVPVFATGVKAESFTGTLDNTDIFRILAPR